MLNRAQSLVRASALCRDHRRHHCELVPDRLQFLTDFGEARGVVAVPNGWIMFDDGSIFGQKHPDLDFRLFVAGHVSGPFLSGRWGIDFTSKGLSTPLL